MSDQKMISEETHTALLQKAVADATSATEKALETKTEEAKTLAAELETVKAEVASLTADNARLNGELDTAQVSLKAAQDKATQLEADVAAQVAAAAKAEVASKRAEQVRNLKLFPSEDYISEKASAWADLTDEAWAERLEEWAKLAPAKTAATSSDTASAMSGTSGDLTKEPDSTDTAAGNQSKPPARRAALGLS